MPGGIKILGTDEFHKLARDLKEAGRGDLAKQMTKDMRTAAQPAQEEMQSNVRGLPTSTSGGASARAARAGHALRNRKKLTDKAKAKAHARSGLRDTVARSVRTTASATGNRAAVRIRAAQAMMPASQRKLPNLMNNGQWRHPTFGRNPWVMQRVPPGWFDKPTLRHGPKVRQEAINVVIRTINKLGS